MQRTVVLLSFATFSSMVAQRICDAMLPELARSFDVGLAQAAAVVSMFAIVYGVAQLVYGPLGDRLGKFRIVAWATLACGVGSVLAALAGSLNALVLARMATGLAAAAVIPLALAWIGDNVPFDTLQETLARVGLGTTLGIAVGQLAGGMLTQTLGWRWAFVFMSLLFGVVGILLQLDWRRQRAAVRAENAGAKTAPSTPRTSFFAQTLPIITGPWSRVVLLVAFAEGAAGFGVLAMWASHLQHGIGMSASGSGAVVALFGLGGMLYMASARRLIARLGQPGLSQAGGGLMGLCALVVAFAPVWPPIVPASLLAGFGFFMFHNTMQANATHMAPGARGTAVSLFSASLFLGQSAGALLAASLIAGIGSRSVVALGGIAMIALGLWFGAVLRRRQHRTRSA
jgi:MFS transporter, YNFM family, putative membrane transport protein